MNAIAAAIGRALGIILAESAPILSEIIANGIRTALSDTTEDSPLRSALRARLVDRLRHANGLRTSNPTTETPQTDQTRSRVDTRQNGA